MSDRPGKVVNFPVDRSAPVLADQATRVGTPHALADAISQLSVDTDPAVNHAISAARAIIEDHLSMPLDEQVIRAADVLASMPGVNSIDDAITYAIRNESTVSNVEFARAVRQELERRRDEMLRGASNPD